MLGMVNMQLAVLADVHADFEAIKVLPQCVLSGKMNGLSFKRYFYPFQSPVVEIRDLPILAAVQKQVSALITSGDLAVGKD